MHGPRVRRVCDTCIRGNARCLHTRRTPQRIEEGAEGRERHKERATREREILPACRCAAPLALPRTRESHKARFAGQTTAGASARLHTALLCNTGRFCHSNARARARNRGLALQPPLHAHGKSTHRTPTTVVWSGKRPQHACATTPHPVCGEPRLRRLLTEGFRAWCSGSKRRRPRGADAQQPPAHGTCCTWTLRAENSKKEKWGRGGCTGDSESRLSQSSLYPPPLTAFS